MCFVRQLLVSTLIPEVKVVESSQTLLVSFESLLRNDYVDEGPYSRRIVIESQLLGIGRTPLNGKKLSDPARRGMGEG